MARTIPSYGTGLAFGGSPAVGDADVTPDCRLPGARGLCGGEDHSTFLVFLLFLSHSHRGLEASWTFGPSHCDYS